MKHVSSSLGAQTATMVYQQYRELHTKVDELEDSNSWLLYIIRQADSILTSNTSKSKSKSNTSGGAILRYRIAISISPGTPAQSSF